MFYDKQRTNDLRKFCEETLIEVVVPEVVLVTGLSTYLVSNCLLDLLHSPTDRWEVLFCSMMFVALHSSHCSRAVIMKPSVDLGSCHSVD